jgi:hypothetical protein
MLRGYPGTKALRQVCALFPVLAGALMAAALIAVVPCRVFAQEPTTQAAADQPAPDQMGRPGRAARESGRLGHGPATQPEEDESEKSSSTEHDITVAGQVIHYRATAAQLPLKDEAGKVRAHIFYVSYEKLGCGQKAGPKPARHVRLQRGSGLGVGLAASGDGRPAAGESAGRWNVPEVAAPRGGQPVHVAGVLRTW